MSLYIYILGIEVAVTVLLNTVLKHDELTKSLSSLLIRKIQLQTIQRIYDNISCSYFFLDSKFRLFSDNVSFILELMLN